MVRLTRIYTRGGDAGQTSLGDGKRVGKDAARIAAYGSVDELSSHLGVCATLELPTAWGAWLARIQNDLFDLGADLCVPPSEDEGAEDARSRLRVAPAQVTWLEERCDEVNEGLEPLTSFILPGGSPLAAQLHVARTVCRRAERAIVTLMRDEAVGAPALAYANRLSDLLFILARAANADGSEVLWIPGASREET